MAVQFASSAHSRPNDGLLAQIPIWPERFRGLPNPIARSSLFTIGNKQEPRAFFRVHKPIQAVAGTVISYKGEELRQDDEDCFMQLVHLARMQPLNEPVRFTAYAFLKDICWATSKEGYERLRLALDRLQGTGLRISEGGTVGYQGALVRKFKWREDDTAAPLAHWLVWLEPEIVDLFGPCDYTQVWWEQRLRLRSPLAKHLHGYYATHDVPHPIRVETLRALTGSKAARLTDFRKALRKALEQLVVEGFLTTWTIDGEDLVHVVRGYRRRAPREPLALTSTAPACLKIPEPR